MRQRAHFFHVALGLSDRDHNGAPFNFVGLENVRQPVVQSALAVAERIIEELASYVQGSVLFQQPGRGAHITWSGAGVGERAGVFVNPQD